MDPSSGNWALFLFCHSAVLPREESVNFAGCADLCPGRSCTAGVKIWLLPPPPPPPPDPAKRGLQLLWVSAVPAQQRADFRLGAEVSLHLPAQEHTQRCLCLQISSHFSAWSISVLGRLEQEFLHPASYYNCDLLWGDPMETIN